MTGSRSILIACPQHGKLVRGTYLCDRQGRCRLGRDGSFRLEWVRCGQDGGRCMETLCALHRYNRRGIGTWYPARILAAPPRRRSPRRPPAREAGENSPSTSSTDVIC